MKAQLLVGQGAGIRGQERAPLAAVGQGAVALAGVAAPVTIDVANLAHPLAGAVGIDQRADMPAKAGIEEPQLVHRIAFGLDAAQQQDAAAVLQLGPDVVDQWREGWQRKIRLRHVLPAEAARCRGGERPIDLFELRLRKTPLPARRARHLAALPDARSSDRLDLTHFLFSPCRSGAAPFIA
jgi:hypothetical protein